MSQSKPKTVRGYFRGKKQVASDTHEPAPVDIDTTKIVWATQTNFSVAAKCSDLIDFVNRNMFSKSSPFGSLYRTLLCTLPIDCPELVVHFDVVRVGNIHSPESDLHRGGGTRAEKEIRSPEFIYRGLSVLSCSCDDLRLRKPTKSSSFSWALRF